MNNIQYVLANADLPFSIEHDDQDARQLWDSACEFTGFWVQYCSATNHQEKVRALDTAAEYISHNWRDILPNISARFPTKDGVI